MMDEICSSETSVLTRFTRRDIPEDGILHTKCRSCNAKAVTAPNGYVRNFVGHLRATYLRAVPGRFGRKFRYWEVAFNFAVELLAIKNCPRKLLGPKLFLESAYTDGPTDVFGCFPKLLEG
jgi:hypothetical protein